jgi:hypothetical protein
LFNRPDLLKENEMKSAVLRRLVAVGSLMVGIPAFAQTLSWSSPQAHTGFTNVGGSSGRNGVAVAQFGGGILVAYTSTNYCSGVNGHVDCGIIIATNGGTGASTAFSNPTLVYTSQFSDGYAVSNDNPALLRAVVNGQETIFLAFKDSYGVEYLASTTNLSSWTVYGVTGANGSVYGPSMALSPDGSTIYIGYMNGSSYNPILCAINAGNPNSQSCANLTGLRTMNFNPGLAFFQGQLYMGFEDRGDSHCLYYDRGDPTTNSFSLWNPLNKCPQQTSAGPNLAVHNGYLHTSYRSNDSSQKFTDIVTTNGSDFGYRSQPGFAVDGSAALLDLNVFPGNNAVLAVYSRSNTLYTTIGQ